MPLFSAFTAFGLLEFSSEPSEAEKIYGALVASYTDPKEGTPTLDLTEGTFQEAKIYGWAMALGGARVTLRRAGNELRAETSYSQLESFEEKFRMSPAATDTVPARRLALAAKQKAARGPRFEAVWEALSAILGDDLVAYRPMTIAEAEAYPAAIEDSPGIFRRNDAIAKSVRVLTAITRASMKVSYENWNRSLVETLLVPGDVLCIDPGNWGLVERVVVTAASGSGATRTFTAAFARPHSAEVMATTGPMPLWSNTKRHVLVVVKAASAVDPATVRRIDDLFRRIMRAPTTWAIVEPTTPGAATVGPFKIGETLGSPLGAVPVESITV